MRCRHSADRRKWRTLVCHVLGFHGPRAKRCQYRIKLESTAQITAASTRIGQQRRSEMGRQTGREHEATGEMSGGAEQMKKSVNYVFGAKKSTAIRSPLDILSMLSQHSEIQYFNFKIGQNN